MSAVWSNLSKQAQITLVTGLLVSVAAGKLSPSRFDPTQEVYRHHPYDWKMALVVMLAYMLVAYNSNCLTLGHCNAWSWISILTPVLSGLTFLLAGISLRRVS